LRMIFGKDAVAKVENVVDVDLIEEFNDDPIGTIDDDLRLSEVSLDVDNAFGVDAVAVETNIDVNEELELEADADLDEGESAE